MGGAGVESLGLGGRGVDEVEDVGLGLMVYVDKGPRYGADCVTSQFAANLPKWQLPSVSPGWQLARSRGGWPGVAPQSAREDPTVHGRAEQTGPWTLLIFYKVTKYSCHPLPTCLTLFFFEKLPTTLVGMAIWGDGLIKVA